jgi:hypothetical protein
MESVQMIKTIHGKIRGRVINLDEDPGLSEDQEVEVRVMVVPQDRPSMSPGLAQIYAILGERFESGQHDVAERHDEHQP